MPDVPSYKTGEKGEATQRRGHWLAVGSSLRPEGLCCLSQHRCGFAVPCPALRGPCRGFSSLPEASPPDLSSHKLSLFSVSACPRFFYEKPQRTVFFFCFRGAICGSSFPAGFSLHPLGLVSHPLVPCGVVSSPMRRPSLAMPSLGRQSSVVVPKKPGRAVAGGYRAGSAPRPGSWGGGRDLVGAVGAEGTRRSFANWHLPRRCSGVWVRLGCCLFIYLFMGPLADPFASSRGGKKKKVSSPN